MLPSNATPPLTKAEFSNRTWTKGSCVLRGEGPALMVGGSIGPCQQFLYRLQQVHHPLPQNSTIYFLPKMAHMGVYLRASNYCEIDLRNRMGFYRKKGRGVCRVRTGGGRRKARVRSRPCEGVGGLGIRREHFATGFGVTALPNTIAM
jgi:hypothetical protein